MPQRLLLYHTSPKNANKPVSLHRMPQSGYSLGRTGTAQSGGFLPFPICAARDTHVI